MSRLEESAIPPSARDHRVIGRELRLFDLVDAVGPGHVIWLPAGATIRRELARWIEDLEIERSYQHVVTPVVAKRDLYVRSGHWGHYQDAMYPVMEREGEEYVLRPMNCPHHIMVYESELRSYRELPLRIAELANMHRWEKSGAVSGMSRVRVMTLNDAHIFCADVGQAEAEVAGVLDLIEVVYRTLGLTGFRYRLSLGDPADKAKYVDDPAMWRAGEDLLRRTLVARGIAFDEALGEAAFYGPKIDIQFMTASGKEETLITIQVDFHLPAQFDLSYIGPDGAPARPLIVHRSVISTLERMVALLIEQYDGAFPLWLSPVQAVVVPIADRHLAYAAELAAGLRAARLRVEVDDRNERMNAKIRDAAGRKIPYVLVVGDREAASRSAAVRLRGGADLGAMPTAAIRERLVRERDARELSPRV